MSTRARPIKVGAILASAALVAAAAPFAATAHAQAGDDDGDPGGAITLDDAEFRWGINFESGTIAPAPKTKNFLSAGDVSGGLTGGMTTLPQGDWKGQDGNVVIEKRDSDGNVTRATEADIHKDRDGAELKRNNQYNGFEAVFTGGQGEIDPQSGTGTIEWDGTITVLFYSGYTYFTISDPVLEVKASSATVTGTLKAHKTDMNNMDLWEELDPEEVTLAELDRDDVELSADLGFAATPKYFGVRYTPKLPELPEQVTSDQYFGSFPSDFVDYVAEAGSGPYWYSSGGAADRRKNPFPLSVCWDASECDELEVPDADGPGGGSGGGSGSGGLLSDVINDFVKGVLDDTADIFRTRIREDLNSVVNGDKTWGDLGSSDLADTTPTGAGVSGAAVRTGTTTDSGDSTTASEDSDDYVLPASGPVNAGTVGYAVTTATSPTSGGNSGTSGGSPSSGGQSNSGSSGNSAPAASTMADNSSPLAAAGQAEGGEVYYADIASKSSATSLLQWQWWVGGALLAIAAGLIYMAARKKV